MKVWKIIESVGFFLFVGIFIAYALVLGLFVLEIEIIREDIVTYTLVSSVGMILALIMYEIPNASYKLKLTTGILLVVYLMSVPLLNFNDIQYPTRNITLFEVIFTWVLVTAIVFPVLILILTLLNLSKPSEESNNQKNHGSIVSKIADPSTKGGFIAISILLALFLLSTVLIVSNYHPYDEYNGGEIGCSNHNTVGLGVVRFSSLNEVDKKVFRMTINNSYLVSVREDLNKTKEYQLMVTKDSGNDEIIIYDAGETDPYNQSQSRRPPDGLLDEPKMDITGSEYFSEELRENQPIQYQGELYRCFLEEFDVYEEKGA